MARALVAALLCAAAAGATRYADYSGVKMPQYAGEYDARDNAPPHPSEVYHGRSPDSPASLDYKYEEDNDVKTIKPAIELEDEDDWHKPARKQRGLAPSDTDILEALEKHNFDVEEASKLKQSHRISQHRSRLKSKSQLRGEQPRRQRHGRRRDDVSDRNDNLLDKDDFQDDKSKEFDDDINPFAPKATERVIRRKARDRFPKGRTQSLSEDEDFFLDRRQTVETAPKMDYDDERRRKQPFERKDQFEDVIDFDEEPSRPPKKKEGMKSYPEYNDNFYDMRRVHNIRDKLPSLLRRTSQTPTSSVATVASVAERQLSAALGGHRQRKDAPSIGTTTVLPHPSFAPQVIAPDLDNAWNEFVFATNRTHSRILSLYAIFLALINYLQRYSQVFIKLPPSDTFQERKDDVYYPVSFAIEWQPPDWGLHIKRPQSNETLL